MNSLFIFRRDFRIVDNTALNYCYKNSDKIYPIFIFTPEQIKNNPFKSNNAIQFMIESLKELDNEIKVSFFYGNYMRPLICYVIFQSIRPLVRSSVRPFARSSVRLSVCSFVYSSVRSFVIKITRIYYIALISQ